MPLASVSAEDAALAGLATVLTDAALHTGSPGTTGANENPATGGYTRVAAGSQSTPSGGSMANATGWSFTTAGTTPITHLGYWSALTVGTYEIGLPLGASVTATAITVAAGAATLGAS